MNLPDTDARAGQAFGEVRDVLTDQIARGREDDHVVVAGQNRVDGHAQHDFGLTGAGRRLQQEFVFALVERGIDFGDGRTLIVGQREAFTRLDQFVGGGDGLTVGVDLRPDVGVGRKCYASDSAPASWSGGVSGVVSVSDGVSDRGSMMVCVIGNSTSRGCSASRSTAGRSSSEFSPNDSRKSGVVL